MIQIRPKTVIETVTIYNVKTDFEKLRRLTKYLRTKAIVNNGKLVAKFKLRKDIGKFKEKVAEILNVRPSQVNISYYETKW